MRTDTGVLHLGQFPQQSFLIGANVLRHFQHNVQKQVSRTTAPRVRHPACTNPQNFARLRAGIDVVLSFAFQARNFDVRAEDGLCVANRNVADQVLAFAFEKRMNLDVNFDKDVTRRSAVLARFALAAKSKQHSRVDAGWNGNLFCEGLQIASGSATFVTLVADD